MSIAAHEQQRAAGDVARESAYCGGDGEMYINII